MFQESKLQKNRRAKAQAEFFAGRNGVPGAYFDTSDTTKRREMAKKFVSLQILE